MGKYSQLDASNSRAEAKLRQWVEVYAATGNTKLAAKVSRLRAKAEDILAVPFVAARLEEVRRQRAARYELDAKALIAECLALALWDAGDAYNDDGTMKRLSEMDTTARKAIVGISTTELKAGNGKPYGVLRHIKFVDKLAAMKLAAQVMGLLRETVKVEAQESLATLLGDIYEKRQLSVTTVTEGTATPVAAALPEGAQ